MTREQWESERRAAWWAAFVEYFPRTRNADWAEGQVDECMKEWDKRFPPPKKESETHTVLDYASKVDELWSDNAKRAMGYAYEQAAKACEKVAEQYGHGAGCAAAWKCVRKIRELDATKEEGTEARYETYLPNEDGHEGK
jgi:hypothetical protein